MGGLIDSLKKNANERRAKTFSINRSKPAEFEQIICCDESETSENPSKEASSSPSTTRSSNELSEFYLACRTNNIAEVKKRLETISLTDIDRIEPNGSTALHAASYYGHENVVRMLLEAGADRGVKNRFKCLPFDEAANDCIKDIFFRIPTNNRYVNTTGAIEYELVNPDVSEQAQEECYIIRTLYDNTPAQKMLDKIQKNYIEKGLYNTEKIHIIRRFFERATEEEDPKWIIKAYSAETDFYKVLNTEIASGATRYQSERRYIVALLRYHPKLDEYVYIGKAHRAVQITNDDVKRYKVNCLLMTKSFVSSSVDEKVINLFICQKESVKKEKPVLTRLKSDGETIRTWVIWNYQIKNRRTALHVEHISQYPVEGEVLIMPYSVFQVKKISQSKPAFLSDQQTITVIELEEVVT